MIATCRGLALDQGQPTASYLRKNFTIEDGLPANKVYAVLQTQNGFLWVGTDAGPARFDGKRFTPINIGRGVARQIPVWSLLTTPEGDLWVGTDAGLARIPSAARSRVPFSANAETAPLWHSSFRFPTCPSSPSNCQAKQKRGREGMGLLP